MRLFLAIDLPEEVQFEIETLFLKELKEVRWTPSYQLHITLVFIGDQPCVSIDEIIEQVAEIDVPPFLLEFKGVGYFKSGIIWLSVTPCSTLLQLEKKLKTKLYDLGLQLENRKFKPHITLGRCKKVTAELMSKVSHAALGFEQHMTVEKFQLKSSYLSSKGAEYSTEAEFIISDITESE